MTDNGLNLPCTQHRICPTCLTTCTKSAGTPTPTPGIATHQIRLPASSVPSKRALDHITKSTKVTTAVATDAARKTLMKSTTAPSATGSGLAV